MKGFESDQHNPSEDCKWSPSFGPWCPGSRKCRSQRQVGIHWRSPELFCGSGTTGYRQRRFFVRPTSGSSDRPDESERANHHQ